MNDLVKLMIREKDMHKITRRNEKRFNFVLDALEPSRLHSKQTETTVKCTQYELSIVEGEDPGNLDSNDTQELQRVSSDLLRFKKS